MKNKHYPFQISMKVEFSQLIFKKYSNVKFHKICPVRAKLLQEDGRTNRHDGANWLPVAIL
jgi:hypothetical protein